MLTTAYPPAPEGVECVFSGREGTWGCPGVASQSQVGEAVCPFPRVIRGWKGDGRWNGRGICSYREDLFFVTARPRAGSGLYLSLVLVALLRIP